MSTLPALLDHLRANRDFVANVVAWERIPARPARLSPFPDSVDPRIADALVSHAQAGTTAQRRSAEPAAVAVVATKADESSEGDEE